MTVNEVMQKIFNAAAPGFHIEKTCDVLHIGDPEAEVDAIATCFMADMGVLYKAAQLGVNLIVTHEPTFYSSWEDTSWLEGNPVYELKKKFIEDNKISIWRFHDHMHAAKRDLIYAGWQKLLGWESYLLPGKNEHLYHIPETTVAGLCETFKKKLNMECIRVIGKSDMKCSNIGVLVGGGSLGLGDELMPAKTMTEDKLDVLVCGEIVEWTSCSFVRDAALLGLNKAMIILGHNRTEECGMQFLPEWIRPLVGDIPVCHISSGDPFGYVV
jgi:putative NIF3 family GTP cyclohydrolase 1 type 2